MIVEILGMNCSVPHHLQEKALLMRICIHTLITVSTLELEIDIMEEIFYLFRDTANIDLDGITEEGQK